MVRRIRNAALAAALLGIAAGAASAGPLVSAVLDFKFGSFPMATFPAAGATGSTTGSLDASLGGGTTFNGTFIDGLASQPPPWTFYTVVPTGNDPLHWTNGPALGSFHGIVKAGGLGGVTLLSIPLNLGAPSTYTKTTGPLSLTAIFASWTSNGTFTLPLSGSSTSLTVMATGANNLTAGGAGTLVLVTPIHIFTNQAPGGLAAFGVLTLTYVPEPGTLLLLGAGVVALALRGRREL